MNRKIYPADEIDCLTRVVIRALLAAAVDDGVISVNPAGKLGRHLPVGHPKAMRQEEIKAMTREQRQVFLVTAANPPQAITHCL